MGLEEDNEFNFEHEFAVSMGYFPAKINVLSLQRKMGTVKERTRNFSEGYKMQLQLQSSLK